VLTGLPELRAVPKHSEQLTTRIPWHCTNHSRNSWLRHRYGTSCSHDLTYSPPSISDTDTSLRDVRGIHTRIDSLAALPAQQYTLLTLELVSPLGCITLTRHTCHYWHASTPHGLRCHRNSPYCSSLCPHLPCLVSPVAFTSSRRNRRPRSTQHHHTYDMSHQTV